MPSCFRLFDALRPPSCLACRLNRRQEQGDQNADDRDHDQQFDEREARADASKTATLRTDMAELRRFSGDPPMNPTSDEPCREER